MRFNIRNFSIFYRNLSLKRISCILLLTFLVYIPIYLFLVDIHHYYYVVNYFGTRIKLFEDKYKNSSNFSKINPTIFCLIKTHPHNIRINKTITTYNIWAKKCDNYRFVTLLPQELIPENVDLNKTIEVFNEFYMIQPKGLTSETHSYLTLKIYHAILFVYRFFPDYDWYHIVDDDAYVNIKSFKRFLRNKNPDNLVSYGHNFKLEVKDGFHSGGPGYALSNAAFTKLSTTLTNNIEDCPNTGLDDVDLNACLRTLGVLMGNSLDEQGKERFLNLGILDHFLGNYTLGHFIYSQNPPKKGFDCCSDTLVAVHYMPPRDMYLFDLAIEWQQGILNFKGKHLKLSKPNCFKNIFLNYIQLRDIEYNFNFYDKFSKF